jgi:hypothetical protein
VFVKTVAPARHAQAKTVSTRVAETGFACPNPMSVQEWRAIQDKRVGAGTLVHSDGAAAYRKSNAGVAHDWVNHSSGRRTATYAKTVVHKRPSGKTTTKAGTQSFALRRAQVNRQSVRERARSQVQSLRYLLKGAQ